MEMGTRIPMHHHYHMKSGEEEEEAEEVVVEEEVYIGNALQDLNVDRGAVTEDSLDNDDETNSDCLHRSYRNSPLALDSVVTSEERIGLENTDTNTGTYDMLGIDDVVPIENARARFLQIFVDHFIDEHVVQVGKSGDVPRQNMSNKRRQSMEVEYEGDPRFVLPLMYVANLYETLVNDVNMRLGSFSNGIHEKSIGISLEAAGGLYRRLASKYPKKGGVCSYKRRELAKSLETRTRFPELVMQEEKHVFRFRFVVVNGLSIVEEPNRMTIEDAEWFKRLTGRSEIRISARDYKFYSPRHKYRIIVSPPPIAPNIPPLPVAQNPQQHTMSKHHIQPFPHHSTENPSQFCNVRQSSHLSQVPQCHEGNVTCIQSPTTLAKFCDQCGTPYLRETSKFCSECGIKSNLTAVTTPQEVILCMVCNIYIVV